jgi:uncharacterized protein (DUF1015 family)
MQEWLKEGILIKEDEDSTYIYSQTYNIEEKTYTRTGFIALIELEELGKNVLPHEKTLPKHLQDRIDLMEHTKSNEGCVFFIYEDSKKEIDSGLNEFMKDNPVLFGFEDDAKVQHRIWRIDDPNLIEKIKSEMKSRKVVIADGHHRYKASLEFKNRHPEMEAAKYRVAAFVNSFNEGLVILPTNRILLNHGIGTGFIETLQKFFSVQEMKSKESLISELNKNKSQKNYLIGFIDNEAKKQYLLRLKNREIMKTLLPNSTGAYRMLDVNILHKLIFQKILGISEEDQANHSKIEFIKGNEETLRKIKDKKYKGAFLINPPLMSEVFITAAAGELMPQKSTYFYPKIFSGLVIYKMD